MNHFFQLEEKSPSGLVWKVSKPPAKQGSVVGTLSPEGYWKTKLIGKKYRVHRIVALLSGVITEEEFLNPKIFIDHIDGDRGNNLPSNLRKSNNRDNLCNQRIHREGKLVGACYNKRRGKWQSQINIQGKLLFLGYFKTEALAHEAYLKAKEEIDGN